MAALTVRTVRQQLTLKEAELSRAEETIRREQQLIQEMRQRVSLVWEVMCSVLEVLLTAGD